MGVKLRCLSPLLFVVLLAACKPQDEAQKPAQSVAPAAPATKVEAGPEKPVDKSDNAETPALKLALLDGSQYDLSAHRGKWVVVNFWATWCKPCLKEMPELSALDVMRGHVEVIGLAYEEISTPAMRRFLEMHPVAYPIAIVDVYDPPADFDTPRGLPMTWLIAPDGTVAREFLGPITAREVELVIAGAGGPKLGEASSSPDATQG